MVAINFCKAIREISPNSSVLLIITDRSVVNEKIEIPTGTKLIILNDYLDKDFSYPKKQALLRDMLTALRPKCFHNINSEVAWNLIISEGEKLKKIVKIYSSIFAFQFSSDGHTKIGYAAYFLEKGLPHLSGLISDNKRFIDDAIQEYSVDRSRHSDFWTVYQPSRLFSQINDNSMASPTFASSKNNRLKILWAGRLDIEKRVDLFLDIVKASADFDFYVFGQVVLDSDKSLPALPNLTYEGSFTSPLEWVKNYKFDAFLFTSKWEGLPNILIEAGSLGIPIIAPTVGGVGELVNQKTGYPLNENPTVADYKIALAEIKNFPETALQKAVSLYELINSRHSWEFFVNSVANITGYIGTPSLSSKTALSDDYSPMVSVVIPCFNQGRYLQESVASALTACRTSLEIIIINDGSTDSNAQKLFDDAVSIAPDIVRVHHQLNQGLSAARNTGINIARGKYIQFLDADDILAPNKIDSQLGQFFANPSIDVSICNFLLCDEERNIYSKSEEAIARFDLSPDDFLYNWERGFSVPIHCGLFRRNIVEKYKFETDIQAKEDWIFWTTIALNGAVFGYIHGHWAIYRQHAQSMRRSYLNMGRSWLQAGLKIESMLPSGRAIFFESFISWFEQCYRSNHVYQEEINEFQISSSKKNHVKIEDSKTRTSLEDIDTKYMSQRILESLSKININPNKPLISVIVPIYGHYKYIERCISSLANQNLSSFEIICIDDASPDTRIGDLLELLKDKNKALKIITQKSNGGISLAQNCAVEAATGEYIAFLDCDDILEDGALSIINNYIERNPNIDYFFTDRQDIDENETTIRTALYGGYQNINFKDQEKIKFDLIDGMIASHLKVIKKSKYQEVGGCDPRFAGVQDWDLALKISRNGNFWYINKSLYKHRIHSNSVTRGDYVSQFRKTNIVRRNYWEFLKEKREILFTGDTKILTSSTQWGDVAKLKEFLEQGYVCAAYLPDSLNISEINFFREFNSYFDMIYCTDSAVAASLAGYLWDPTMIKLCTPSDGD